MEVAPAHGGHARRRPRSVATETTLGTPPIRGRDLDLVAVRGEACAPFGTVGDDVVQLGGFVGEHAGHGFVAVCVANKPKTHALHAAAVADGDGWHHADPVAVPPAAVAGVKAEAAEAVEDRAAMVASIGNE